jgi:putative membrane protein insertion efficiency factor
MGHCNSPAQHGSHSGFCADHARPAEADSKRAAAEVASARPSSATTWVLVVFLQIYKTFLSPFFGGACKYQPSCSNYALEAIKMHGAARGSILALKRLGRCRPFKQGGFDPVPSVDEVNCGGLGSGEPELMQ